MTDATEPSDLEIPNLQKCASPKIGISRRSSGPRQSIITGRRAPARHHGASTAVLQEPDPSVEMQGAGPSELNRLYRSLAGVTSETHPRTAGLLKPRAPARLLPKRSSRRKVRRSARGGQASHPKRRSRDARICSTTWPAQWHRAGIDPTLMCGSRCTGAPTSSASPKSHPKPGAKIGIGPFTTSCDRRKGMDHDCHKRTGGVAEARYRAATRCRCRPEPSASRPRQAEAPWASARVPSHHHRQTWAPHRYYRALR